MKLIEFYVMNNAVSFFPCSYISFVIDSKLKIVKNTVLTTIDKVMAINRVNNVFLCLRQQKGKVFINRILNIINMIMYTTNNKKLIETNTMFRYYANSWKSELSLIKNRLQKKLDKNIKEIIP